MKQYTDHKEAMLLKMQTDYEAKLQNMETLYEAKLHHLEMAYESMISNLDAYYQAKLQNMETDYLIQIHNLKAAIVEDVKNEVERMVTNMEKKYNKVIKQQNSFVSFTAYATVTRNYDEGDIVQFDGIQTNFGGYYSPLNGVFRCPWNGYYMFSVSVMSLVNGPKIHVELLIDGTTFLAAYAADEDTYDHGSIMGVNLCTEGQEVYVRSRFNGQTLYGTADSTFHATLLRVQ